MAKAKKQTIDADGNIVEVEVTTISFLETLDLLSLKTTL